ncbi:MAG: hypothetical protein HQK84_09985, partial [Nitrospinae bacterium]|nr:hypothetical protein [Nitrospinota bacterium]
MDICSLGLENKKLNITKKNGDEVSCEVCDLVPQGLCPVAYNCLVPYIQTLRNDGWFTWVTKKNNGYRKSINKDDFSKRSVNRLYPNEVLVQCPSNEISVLFGVG